MDGHLANLLALAEDPQEVVDGGERVVDGRGLAREDGLQDPR
jgi:hypothetical protein